MNNNTVTVPVAAWGENSTLILNFPEGWKVTHCTMKGHDTPGISDEKIREALANPYSTPPIREMAKGKERVVILFDDLQRPTPVYRMVPFVLDELHAAGIQDAQIRFVSAIGTHGLMTRADFVKKLGEDIVERYSVYNHNIYDNVVEVGTTSFGTKVFINREVASCDLKIGIGGVIPYYKKYVYNGGGKIILPGVSGIQTIYDFHVSFQKRMNGVPPDPQLGEGIPPYRVNLEEAARLAGLDMKVDLVQNNRKEVVGVFAGDFIQTHRRATDWGKEIYTTTIAPPSDIVVLNTYPKEDQPLKGLWFASQSTKPGGDMVVISHSRNGLSHHHHLFGRFGTDYGGPAWKPERHFDVGEAHRVIFVSPYLSKSDKNNFPGDNVLFVKTWDEARAMLVQTWHEQATVAVYPYGGIQMAE
jgi:nickel-dependent lactate racemase